MLKTYIRIFYYCGFFWYVVLCHKVNRYMYTKCCNSYVQMKVKTIKIVTHCVAAGCSSTNSNGVSLFQFPQDPVLRIASIKHKTSAKLTSLLQNSHHLKDITRLICYQTSSLESFHNVVIHFAPKSVVFSYVGVKSR